MLYNIRLKFIQNDSLEEPQYSKKSYLYQYEVNDCDFNIGIGDRCRIKSADGYNYKNSIVEIMDIKVDTEKSLNFVQLASVEVVDKFKNSDLLKDVIIYTTKFEDKENYRYEYRSKLKREISYGDTIRQLEAQVKKRESSPSYEIFLTSKNDNLGITNNKKEEVKGMKMFKNLTFGKYCGTMVKISVKGLAYLNKNTNSYQVYDATNKTMIDVSDFTIDLDGMLYEMPVSVKDIKAGDIIKHNNDYVIVVETEGGMKVIDPNSGEQKTIIPSTNIFGFNFYTKMMNFAEGLFGTSMSEENPFGDMLPFLLMSKDNDTCNSGNNSMKDILLMNMLSGNKELDFSNPMMMMMLMGDNNSDILPFLMMGNMGNMKKEDK